MDYKEVLADAIQKGYGCKAVFKETVPIKETFQGKTVWDGEVEVFEVNHKDTRTCYGWGFDNDKGKTEFVTVLAIPPITTPLKAVQSYLISLSKRR
jgi:hypothetical protein